MKFCSIFCIIFVCSISNLFGQIYPTNYFSYPMDTPLYLSAPFGSIRDNHFHSGMDIRTNEVEGLPVYAIADGYISRVKIQSVGYGKAIYIDHPNGYTSVYGHLQNYAQPFAAYIKSIQYQNESFDIDHFPAHNKLKVSKGQLIGYSGNTGTSSGPHLHFEIRDTKSEFIINPQLFDILGKDSLSPRISEIIFYGLTTQRPIAYLRLPLTNDKTIKIGDIIYYKDTVTIAPILNGIGIIANDFLISTKQEYNIYSASFDLDNKNIFSFKLNRFPFDKTRAVNVHIDYANYKRENQRIQKMFLDDGNKIPLYPFVRNKGKFKLNNDQIHQARLTVGDFKGNNYQLMMYLKYGKVIFVDTTTNCSGNICYPTKNNVISKENYTIQIPENALYDTLNICIESLAPNKEDLSESIKINAYTIPLYKSIGVSIKPNNKVQASLQSKLCLYYKQDINSKKQYVSSSFADGFVAGKSSNFGIFGITVDSIAPKINLIAPNKIKNVKDSATIELIIDDNFSGIGNYKCTMNGKWILFEYDAKRNLLFYKVDEKMLVGQNELEVIVTDKKNNIATFKTILNKE